MFNMNIDNKFNFSNHIRTMCKKINKQFQVMLPFRNLIPRDTLLKLYKAFILPNFDYCSSVWHFCDARNTDKMEALNKRIFRFILQDNISTYSILLSKVNLKSLYTKRLRKFLIILYKSLFNSNYSRYIRSMFTLRDAPCGLRGNHILSLPRSKTTTNGLHSSYLAAKLWNSLPDIYRTSAASMRIKLTRENQYKRLIRGYF